MMLKMLFASTTHYSVMLIALETFVVSIILGYIDLKMALQTTSFLSIKDHRKALFAFKGHKR